MRKILLGFTVCTLIFTSCSKDNISESLSQNNNQLKFSMLTGTATRAFETMQGDVEIGAVVGDEIVLHAYETGDGTTYAKWYNSLLWNVNPTGLAEWKIGSLRFANEKATKYVTYWPASNVTNSTGFDAADFKDVFPSLDYTILDVNNQEDLMAGADNVATDGTNVVIKLRHLLSQINFGVYGYTGASISISNIQIKGVANGGTYTYNGSTSYPIGNWGALTGDETYDYPQYGGATSDGGITDPGIGAGKNGNIFIFGDGGNFAVGRGNNVFYDHTGTWSTADLFTYSIGNSLMLMPQTFSESSTASVEFSFTITSWDGKKIVEDATGTFLLKDATPENAEVTPVPAWQQNLRYVYIIDLTNFIDGKKLTFDVNVTSQPWLNYDTTTTPPNAEDGTGIIDIGTITMP